jgi:hypothetical protein
MRKVTYGGAISLDGFLAGPNEEIDWLRYSDDVAEIMKQRASAASTRASRTACPGDRRA